MLSNIHEDILQLWFFLFREASLIARLALAILKDKLAYTGAGIERHWGVAEVNNLQDLPVADSRLHEAGGDMHGQPEAGKATSAFQSAGDAF